MYVRNGCGPRRRRRCQLCCVVYASKHAVGCMASTRYIVVQVYTTYAIDEMKKWRTTT